MLAQRRSISVAVTSTLLFLSLAVFGLGLHNKLCLYKATRHLRHRVVKLSVRQRSAKSLLAQEGEPGSQPHISAPESPWVPFVPLFQGNARYFSHTREAELKLCIPCRYDSFGPNRLPLPPPTLS